MEKHSIIIYIIATVIVTNLIRIVPVTLIRKRINNQYIRSFLYYVPYVTLAVMTFPAILDATGSPLAGALAFIIGIIGAWLGLGLMWEALLCCVIVLLTEALLQMQSEELLVSETADASLWRFLKLLVSLFHL